MKKLRKLLILFAAGIIAGAPVSIYGAGVNVTLPSFNVTLNGIKQDNAYSKYPLIVYKNITYFPMTYNQCRMLGLETDWNQASGLKITKGKTQWYTSSDTGSVKNQNSYGAAIAKLPITVNGEAINNSKETYPLLQFRDVTYFPLTWRFAVDCFGWNYRYDGAKGLAIQSAKNETSDGAKEVLLPVAKIPDSKCGWGAFIKFGDYFYYEGDKGVIYKAPVSNPSSQKSIYQVPANAVADDLPPWPDIWLETRDNKLFLNYHSGYGVMGRDHEILIKADDTTEDVSATMYSHFDEYEIENLTIKHEEERQLAVKEKGASEFKNLGKYSLGVSGDVVIGDYIYVTSPEAQMDLELFIYKINYKTGEVTKISDMAANRYTRNILDGNSIYFSGMGRNGLYKISTEGGKSEKLSDFTIRDIAVLSGTPFYTTLDKGILYMARQNTSLNPGCNATEIFVRDGYLYAYFSEGPYKIMLFDKNGKAVAKTTENVVDLYMENGKPVYIKGQ